MQVVHSSTRREFLQVTGVTGTGLFIAALAAPAAAEDKDDKPKSKVDAPAKGEEEVSPAEDSCASTACSSG